MLASAPLVVPVLAAHAVGLSASGDVGLWVTRAGWTLAGLAAFTGALVAAVRLRPRALYRVRAKMPCART